MKRSIFETLLGAAVILLAGYFLYYSYETADAAPVQGGYIVTANFPGIGGLAVGDDVQISGVKVGNVSGVELDPVTYLAKVSMNIDGGIEIPADSAATISSESLLGGKVLSLEPGADDIMLEDGERIRFTQAPQNLEQLLGKFIFTMNKDDDEAESSPAPEFP